MKYKDKPGIINGNYIGTKIGTPIHDALSEDDDGYDYIRGMEHCGTIMQDAADTNFPQPILLSIEVTTMPTKLIYDIGEVFNSAGMVVTAYYSGGTREEIDIDDVTITGFSSAAADAEQELTVTYEQKTDTFEISIVPSLVSIGITTPPTKLQYTVGETLDLTGIVVIGTYSDESTAAITITAANVSGFDSSVPAASQILTVTVDGKTDTFTISIISE